MWNNSTLPAPAPHFFHIRRIFGAPHRPLKDNEYITCRDLPGEITGVSAAESAAVPHPLRDRASEEEQIRRALAAAGGNKSQAAKLLGIDRKTLYNKLHLYGIE